MASQKGRVSKSGTKSGGRKSERTSSKPIGRSKLPKVVGETNPRSLVRVHSEGLKKTVKRDTKTGRFLDVLRDVEPLTLKDQRRLNLLNSAFIYGGPVKSLLTALPAMSEHTVIFADPNPLTPSTFQEKVLPHLNALQELQDVFDLARKRKKQRTLILRTVAYFCPVQVGFDGVGDAINAVKEDLVPWRRRHAQKLAQLEEQDRVAGTATKRAEEARIRAEAAVGKAEAKKLRAEADKAEAEAQSVRIANKKAEFELNKIYFDFAMELAEKYFPKASVAERMVHAMQMLPQIKVLSDGKMMELGP